MRFQRTHALSSAIVTALLLLQPFASQAQTQAPTSPSFIAFESGHVRPLAMSPDGSRLFAVNTPNNSLDVFKVTPEGLVLQSRVPVGLEPVAVAARSNSEVWVVNHLSDSVSIVSLDGTPRVVRTLLVGDEPRDIVFAGSPARAFITTAHRGQHLTDPSIAHVPGSGDPKLTTPGIGRADVWVFDALNHGNTLGGTPERILSFFADTPRALAVSPDRNTVYLAAFKSGNQTSVAEERTVCDGFVTDRTCTMKNVTYPGGLPGPKTNVEGKPAPETGLIVKYNNARKRWEDELGRDWSKATPFNLPDKDVFAIDAATLREKAVYTQVGTTLFNMAVNPVSGVLYVSNTEANNLARFEGPGQFAGKTLQGKLALSRVTVVSPTGVQPRHLNKHIDYTKLAHNPGFDPDAKQHSLSMPLGMAVTRDGKTLYVAAYGSSRIGVFSTAEIESDTFDPRKASARHITVSGGGPSGMVLDEARARMYVMTRFDNAIKVLDLASRVEVAKAVLPNPEPAEVVAGRPFLYDAMRSSANGEASCASCHIFGDEDALAWDLGNPDDKVTTSTIPGKLTQPIHISVAKLVFGLKARINGSDNPKDFHPMKGPMTTQTLRGMRNAGAMHWRGDRSTGMFGTSAKDSTLSFINFAVAFEGLLGNARPFTEEEMRAFANFQLSVMLPPNPVRRLDNTLTAAQQRGMDFYKGSRPSDGIILINSGVLQTSHTCLSCHALDPAQGFFGTNGDQSFEGLTQIVKVPHLRNLYQRVGMFGAPAVDNHLAPGTGHTGDQVRGFGFTHEGSIDTVFRFFTLNVFRNTLNTTGFPAGEEGNALRRDMEDLMMAFESDLAPIVGQQVTLSLATAPQVNPRIDLLIQRATTPFVSKELGGRVTECDLIATMVEAGTRRGHVYDVVNKVFVRNDGQQRGDAALRALARVPGQEITYTCAPPGSGRRMAFGS